ncbi:hypothetical protein NECHADRAFT_90636 [Paecilomyces variotii No. 5]|uniref:CAIB/BAIF family enzyme n=1 Tax=Byssochlamys spectabilis (strain No. 5 / NBRC 109023) TaxID=1356009 RepID=V5G4P5_BYSSN|nr:hypothetical protein NECHADRAFT_90636 [Paecilomyces variotii No. 5]
MRTLQDDRPGAPDPLCQIVTPVGMLGYGFSDAHFEYGLELARKKDAPTAIILDSGSTDSGPSKLAFGSMTCPRASYVRDLRKLVRSVQDYRMPLLISSAGGDGSDSHVEELLDIIKEILDSPDTVRSTSLKVIAIYSEPSRDVVVEKFESGKVSGCGPCVPQLTLQDIQATSTIVGQIGPEPFVQAMAAHPDFDILIAGRAYDPSPYVAFCAFHAFRQSYRPVLDLNPYILGGFTHMGKIMECGGLCATPKSGSSMATIYPDGTFDVRPLAPGSRCTPISVAAHALYEKSRPDHLHGPGGYIDLSRATYLGLADDISVRVHGANFYTSKRDGHPYTIKLEGAKLTGYRTIFMGSFGDPILVSQLDSFLASVKAYVKKQHIHSKGTWSLGFHIYGRGVASEKTAPGEVFVVGEASAETQTLATSIASTARIACVHGPYDGQKATSGNFGMGIGGKMEIEMGSCAEFSLYHLIDLDEGQEEAIEIKREGDRTWDQNGTQNGSAMKKLIRWEMLSLGKGPRIDRADIGSPPKVDVNEAGMCLNPTISPTAEVKPTVVIRGPCTLRDIAKVIRSKNAGPFEITLDVMFEDEATYERIKQLGILTPKRIAELYGLAVEDIVWCGFFDPALAFKVTIPRRRDGKNVPSGGPMESDVHGSQKYFPLASLQIDAW